MVHPILAEISTSACSQVIVPEASAQALSYYESGNILWIILQAWSLIIPLLFLMKGFTGKLAAFSHKCGKVWFFTIAVYLILFTLLYALLNLPLDFYAGYLREHQYGLSTQPLGRWLGNYVKGMIVTLVIAVSFVWVFYLLLKKSPKRWWFYSSIASIAFMFLMTFIQPIWIDPLFSTFGPMKDKRLEKEILDLAAKSGITGARVFEVNKSQDTSTLNAYVVGFGATNRIVLWDTTTKQLTPDQTLFVMGHEMGHYVLHHNWWSLLFFSALSFAVFYLTYKSANFLMKRHAKRFGFHELHNIGSLPLLLLLMSVFLLLASPLSNYVSRLMEHEADRFGLEITQNNEAAAEAFIVLQKKNLANPRPGNVYKIWQGTHPPLAERVEFANSYCPWKRKEPLKYGSHFKEASN